jgi:ferredoxin-nitrite reductase
MNDPAFSTEQQEYLKGFMAGVEARRGGLGLQAAPAAANDPARAAQERAIAAGERLTAEEHAKRAKHPLDRYDEIAAMAAAGQFPRGTDVFLHKYHGLFYVAPAEAAYMCRLRIPGGILPAWQFRHLAAIAERHAGGFCDITTRANLQLRGIAAEAALDVLHGLAEIGLTARGSGADNVRNITASPTAGIDPDELIDTRPLVRALHHYILNHREFYALPRKFNIAFDGGGRIAVLEDTNDIALTAMRVAEGFGVAPGVYFRLGLGGITGHGDFARPTGVIVPPDEVLAVCGAILRVFIAEGSRSDRGKARLKYVLDRLGMETFLARVADAFGAPLRAVPAQALQPARAAVKHGHLGILAQRQEGLHAIGLVCPQGRLSVARMHGLADIAERFGSGTLRFTVWQSLLLSDIPAAHLPAAQAAIAALGLGWEASGIRGGLVACTGSAGCRFAAADTKRDAQALADWLEARIAIDQPLNIHLTGCPHSCAQHAIADIGLLATKIAEGEDFVSGYDLYIGGGAGPAQRLGRLARAKLPLAAVAPHVLALLDAWQSQRQRPDEGFQDFAARLDESALAAILAGAG